MCLLLGESLAIVCIILTMALMYRRAGNRDMALLALPLVCVPVARLINISVLGVPSAAEGKPLSTYVFVVGGLVLTVAFCTLVSMKIQGPTMRMAYIIFSFIFSGALTIAYLIY